MIGSADRGRAAGWVLRQLPTMQGSRLAVLIYHRVLAEPDALRPADPVADEFAWQLDVVRRMFEILPLSEAVPKALHGELRGPTAAVTFDDGYADNAEIAYPVLKEKGVSATVFVSTGFLNGARMFNDTVIEAVRRIPVGRLDLAPLGLDLKKSEYHLANDDDRRRLIAMLLPTVKYALPEERARILDWLESRAEGKLPDDLMMTDRDVRHLHRAGVEIGAHTVTHPILARLPESAAREEITQSKHDLEALLGAPVTLFAYPNGKRNEDYTQIHVDQVREAGFEAAVTTHPGTARHGGDRFEIPRFTPWDRTPARFALRLALNVMGRIEQ